MARIILTYILFIGGSAALVIALLHVVFGVESIPGGGYANATLESEDRFYAVIFAGYGTALLYSAQDVDGRARLIRFLTGLFFAGALARIISWLHKGRPHPFFVAMLVLELVLPVVIWSLQAQITRQSPKALFSRREYLSSPPDE